MPKVSKRKKAKSSSTLFVSGSGNETQVVLPIEAQQFSPITTSPSSSSGWVTIGSFTITAGSGSLSEDSSNPSNDSLSLESSSSSVDDSSNASVEARFGTG
ncbi:hypothetical protein ACH5RR_033665 [Cinchona calisaya]|uniref:Uncharacterized protein n=1 Tax=Cinchona calisaya TaxID=153742 RepID=A0ABD2YCI4_9GENT